MVAREVLQLVCFCILLSPVTHGKYSEWGSLSKEPFFQTTNIASCVQDTKTPACRSLWVKYFRLHEWTHTRNLNAIIRHYIPWKASLSSRTELRGGFKNMFAEQCRNLSRGEADRPRFKEFKMQPINETARQEIEEEMREVKSREFEEKLEMREATKHIIPPDIESNPRWEKNLRACCICGMLKTEDMFLDYGCDNCPFLLPPGSRDVDRVQGASTAFWRGLWSVVNEPEEMAQSMMVAEKFPRGLLTASKMPAKGMYCLGFFRPLNPHLRAELIRRGIDPTPRLWNKDSAACLNYSEAPLWDESDQDSDLSGFIDNTPRDKWGNPITAAEMVDDEEGGRNPAYDEREDEETDEEHMSEGEGDEDDDERGEDEMMNEGVQSARARQRHQDESQKVADSADDNEMQAEDKDAQVQRAFSSEGEGG